MDDKIDQLLGLVKGMDERLKVLEEPDKSNLTKSTDVETIKQGLSGVDGTPAAKIKVPKSALVPGFGDVLFKKPLEEKKKDFIKAVKEGQVEGLRFGEK